MNLTKSEPVESDDVANVLIVEDEKDLRELYKLWLDGDYNVEIAQNGEEGLKELTDNTDVMLLDRRMPLLTGDEVLDIIHERDISVRVAVVSAVTPDFDVIDLGFDDYLVKPVNPEKLSDTIDRLLERQEYDDISQKFTRLMTAKARLESQKEKSELKDSEEYQTLVERIEYLEEKVMETMDDFEEDDYKAMFRDIGANNGFGSDLQFSMTNGDSAQKEGEDAE